MRADNKVMTEKKEIGEKMKKSVGECVFVSECVWVSV